MRPQVDMEFCTGGALRYLVIAVPEQDSLILDLGKAFPAVPLHLSIQRYKLVANYNIQAPKDLGTSNHASLADDLRDL